MNTITIKSCLIFLFLLIGSALSQDTYKYFHIIYTDHEELVEKEKILGTLKYPDSNGFCITWDNMYQWNETMVKKYGGNTIFYKDLRKPSVLDTCIRGTIQIFNTDSNSLVDQRSEYYRIEGESKYALKTLGGYGSELYFVGFGFEYVFNTYPDKSYRALLMPEILIINYGLNKVDIQLSGPTLFGWIDGFMVKRINEEGFNFRYGLKVDGGFIITELLSEIFPSHWFKYGMGPNYRTTFQPYASYTTGNSKVDEEYRIGIVITRWLNKSGLAFSPYK